MAKQSSPFSTETFRFFRELAKNNSKVWMDANRDRYQQHVVGPFRALLDALAPAALALHPDFDVSGKTGKNFSRINRDIRFSKDKTPYRPQMYLTFSNRASGGWDGGQFYVGATGDSITWGFRVYDEWKSKNSPLADIVLPRVTKNPNWVKQQRKRLGREYESYWYSSEKDEWIKNDSWPAGLDNWKRLKGWIVRKKANPAAATKSSFVPDVAKTYRELFPLYAFTSLKKWRG
jgi:uncharacterized protein (TIGR02453 family)